MHYACCFINAACYIKCDICHTVHLVHAVQCVYFCPIGLMLWLLVLSLSIFVYLPPDYLSIIYIYLSIHPSIYLSTYLPVCLSVCLSIYLCVYLWIHPSTHSSIITYPSIYIYLYPFILSLHIRLSTSLSNHQSTPVLLSVYTKCVVLLLGNMYNISTQYTFCQQSTPQHQYINMSPPPPRLTL